MRLIFEVQDGDYKQKVLALVEQHIKTRPDYDIEIRVKDQHLVIHDYGFYPDLMRNIRLSLGIPDYEYDEIREGAKETDWEWWSKVE